MISVKALDAMRQITTELEDLFALLQPVASGFARVAGLGRPVREDLIDLRGAISDVVERPGPIAGAGVIVAPGILVDSPYWMEWWWAVPHRDPEALRVNVEPTAPDFFDYTSADWYAIPERTGTRYVAGPYVDYVCRTEYAITLARPVRAAGAFVGVAALDIAASRFERRVLPVLSSLPNAVTLVNAAGRVIVSTAPTVWPGERVPASAGEPLGEASVFGWQLIGSPDVGE
ncbi:MAG TPA: cache domain-containing protein [Microbacteriaceae bacterium]